MNCLNYKNIDYKGSFSTFKIALIALVSVVLIWPAFTLSAKMLPINEVASAIQNFDDKKDYHKQTVAETIAIIKDLADASGLGFTKIRYLSAFNNDDNIISTEYNFAAPDLISFSNFIDEIALEGEALNISMASFNVISQKDPAHVAINGRTAKIFNIAAVIRRYKDGGKVHGENLSEYSAIIRYCSSKYEISSIILSENNSQLSLSGSFSLKGTKKSFLEFIRESKFKGVSGCFISEKDFETRPNQITIPFLAEIFFNK